MKKMIFLLVSAVALLYSEAAPTHPYRENLNHIIDLAPQYNASFYQDNYVEDVEHLVESGCENKFFCKVQSILKKHKTFAKREEDKKEKAILRNFEIFINGTEKNCAELVKDVRDPGIKTTIPTLVGHLVKCIQKRNMSGV